MKKIHLQLFFGFTALSSLLFILILQILRIYNLLEKEFASTSWSSSGDSYAITVFSFFIAILSLICLFFITFININKD